MLVIYPGLHNYQRSLKIQNRKHQYRSYRQYYGPRYRFINQIVAKDQKYFTTRSIFTRHRQLTIKYHYDFDPQNSYVLGNLKNTWNQLLFKYLSMFGDGYYMKKKSSKDKMKFKQQNNFTLKKNPLSRMIDILQKYNYSLVIMKLFNVISVDNNNCKSELNQQIFYYQNSDTQSCSSEQSQIINSNNKNCLFIKKAKFMKLFDQFKQQGNNHYRRRRRGDQYITQSKLKLQIKKKSRKPLKQKTIQKIVLNWKLQNNIQ